MCVLGQMKHPGMLSVWRCHILVTKGRTLTIRLQMNIVVKMCSVLLLIACFGRIVSLWWVGRFLCFVSNVFCTSFTSTLNLRFDLILGGGGWSELVRAVAHYWFAALRAVVLSLCIFNWSTLQLPIILMVCILDWITVCILNVYISCKTVSTFQ